LGGDQNPHKSGFISLTASSNSDDSWKILEYSREKSWCTNLEPRQWLLFDLKGFSFKIEKIRFDVSGSAIPRHWQLLGSNDSQTWATIHDQGNDERCQSTNKFIVDYAIQSNAFFTFFKFQQLEKAYDDDEGFTFYSVEFIGRFNPR
jgi:hypothetical protein